MTDPRTGGDAAPEPDETPTDDYLDDDGAFDLDRYQAETRRKPYPFRWGGQLWELPNVYDLPFSILDLVDSGDDEGLPVEKVVSGLRAAFGPEQWNAINELQPLPIMSTVELFNRWMVFCGVDRGEAESFAASSASTAKPSKRTSPRSTGSGSTKPSTGRKKAATRRVNSSR